MTTAASAPAVETLDGDALDLEHATCIVVGYAGRDAASVQHHIDELAAIGVAPPPEIPMFYPMPTELLTTEEALAASATSSGEAEPVVIRHEGRYFLGLGSDHTDRTLETVDILASKVACVKPISARFVEIDLDTFAWDDCEMRAVVDGTPYQSGTLASLRTPQNVFDLMESRGVAGTDGTIVVFGGTLPLLTGEFVYGTLWELELTLPDGRTIHHTYRVAKS